MPVRPPAVAGRFYPGGPEKLHDSVTQYLEDADVTPAPQGVITVVAPHAGYPFSGPTAGHAFRRVRGMRPGRVVLLGPSHHFRFDGLSVYNRGGWETPLGRVAIDETFADQLAATVGNTCPEAHQPEHALEVELPFLQLALEPGFSIVPVLFGGGADAIHREVADYLAEHLDPGDLIVASTDLSHFLTEKEANRIDRHSLDLVLAGDPEGVRRGMTDQTCSMCGAGAVVTAMAVSSQAGASERRLWDYRTSARTSGDYSRVVGYGAVTLERGPSGR